MNEPPAFQITAGNAIEELQTLQQVPESVIRAELDRQAAKQGKRFCWETRQLVDL